MAGEERLSPLFNAVSGDPDAPAFDLSKWYGVDPEKIHRFGFANLGELGVFVHKYLYRDGQGLEAALDPYVLARFCTVDKKTLRHDSFGDLDGRELVQLRKVVRDIVSNGAWMNSNCYGYSVDDHGLRGYRGVPASFMVPSPGQKSGREYIRDDNTMTPEGIMALAEQDGLQRADIDDVLNQADDGRYLVALYIAPGEDYHWARQNPDDTWSYQDYRGGDIRLALGGDMCPVRYPHIDEPVHVIDDVQYSFAGYMWAPEGGLNVGKDAPRTDHENKPGPAPASKF